MGCLASDAPSLCLAMAMQRLVGRVKAGGDVAEPPASLGRARWVERAGVVAASPAPTVTSALLLAAAGGSTRTVAARLASRERSAGKRPTTIDAPLASQRSLSRILNVMASTAARQPLRMERGVVLQHNHNFDEWVPACCPEAVEICDVEGLLRLAVPDEGHVLTMMMNARSLQQPKDEHRYVQREVAGDAVCARIG